MKNYSTILVTGGAGFIGSNVCLELRAAKPRARIIAMDNLKRRGSELNIQRLKDAGVHFVHADIRNPEDLVTKERIDLLIECSAEPSVMAGSSDNPAYIINTNLVGTINCLELCRKHKADIIFLSTSRVYSFDALNGLGVNETKNRFEWKKSRVQGFSASGINEDFTIQGAKTLYGATKMASELLITEYARQFGVRSIINRCGVIAGPWQFGKVDQGVFTLWMLAHYFKKPLTYIGFGGKGKQVRDLLHVDDLSALIISQIERMDRYSGSVYTVGGGFRASLSLLETTALCSKISGNTIPVASAKEARYGDIRIFLTDSSKVQKDFSWEPLKDQEEILFDIYEWIHEHESALKNSLQL